MQGKVRVPQSLVGAGGSSCPWEKVSSGSSGQVSFGLAAGEVGAGRNPSFSPMRGKQDLQALATPHAGGPCQGSRHPRSPLPVSLWVTPQKQFSDPTLT